MYFGNYVGTRLTEISSAICYLPLTLTINKKSSYFIRVYILE